MIEALTRDYLDKVDTALPGFVRGLYLVGSAALGAWQQGVSDVDAIVLTSRTASAGDLADLAKLHGGMPASPHFDAVYLDPAMARAQASDRQVVPFVVNGTFQTDRPCGELTPVVWLTLRRYGIPVRGPSVEGLEIRVDDERLRQYNLDNLCDYWASHAASFPAALADVASEQVMDAGTVTWFVLGPARLHYTLAYGDIVSKAAAGDHLARLFPEYADLALRAVRWRAGEPERFTAADLSAAGRSVVAVADDAWARFDR